MPTAIVDAPDIPETPRLVLALLDVAPALERLMGADWPRVRDRLLDLAGRLDQGDDRVAVGRDFDALLELLLADPRASVRELAQRTLSNVILPESDAAHRSARPGVATDRSPEELSGIVAIPVFYGTDRARGENDQPANYYSGTRGTPSFGIARVSVPTLCRAVGDLTGPSWWRLEFRADPAKHVILLGVQSHEKAHFVDQLRESLATADERDVLLFVHGYNVSFESAARRAAQLCVDLKFAGRTLMYSWASAADAKQYTVDEDTIDWSRNNFQEFLRLALTDVGARHVHVVAHSMGNRALMNALERLEPQVQSASGAATLCQVIFAAPDIGRDRFFQLADAFKGRAQRFTLYASSRDVALKASRIVHGYPRAGEAGEGLVIVEGVDTIDASTVDTSLVGLRHSYFGSHRSIINDIASLVALVEPDKRFDLRSVGEIPAKYWCYRQ